MSPYQFLEDIATADVAFKATGKTQEELFLSCADALVNVMVDDLASVQRKESKVITVEADTEEMLLFRFLQEFIFYKDANELLLRAEKVTITTEEKIFKLKAQVWGEKIEPQRHPMNVDVKAVTFHLFQLRKINNLWQAQVVLDI